MLIWQSALVFAHILSGGAILAQFVQTRWVGLFVLTVSAAQAATAFYQRGASQRAEGVWT